MYPPETPIEKNFMSPTSHAACYARTNCAPKKKIKEGVIEKEKRERAFSLLHENKPQRQIARKCGLSKRTVSRLKACIKNSNKQGLAKPFDPVLNGPGCQTVLTEAEAVKLNKKVKEAAKMDMRLICAVWKNHFRNFAQMAGSRIKIGFRLMRPLEPIEQKTETWLIQRQEIKRQWKLRRKTLTMLCHYKCSFKRSWKCNPIFSMNRRNFGILMKPL